MSLSIREAFLVLLRACKEMGAERCSWWRGGQKMGAEREIKVLESGMSPEQAEGERFL